MRAGRRTLLLWAALLSSTLLASAARAQGPPVAACQPTPTPVVVKPDANAAATNDAGGIRVFLYDAEKKPLARKRFYLLRRSAFSAGLDWASMPKRADFLQGASPQLREWLARHDCDSLYCPEFEAEFPEAVKTVPEFKRAYDDGLRKYRSEKLALKWLTVNFPLKNVRTEYYKRKKAWLDRAEQQAGAVVSFMTDDKGRAIFTGFQRGDYYISNLFPFDEGGPVWDCKVMTLPPNPRQLWAVSYVLSNSRQ
ncbi:MAG: hypothetical protein JOZ96_02125 [Acidobacteria bacterium]|nr:hypothetical protein [Acidobacteriota bacterium]